MKRRSTIKSERIYHWTRTRLSGRAVQCSGGPIRRNADPVWCASQLRADMIFRKGHASHIIPTAVVMIMTDAKNNEVMVCPATSINPPRCDPGGGCCRSKMICQSSRRISANICAMWPRSRAFPQSPSTPIRTPPNQCNKLVRRTVRKRGDTTSRT